MAKMKPHVPLDWIKENLVWLPSSELEGPIGKYIVPFQEQLIRKAYNHDGSPQKNLFLGFVRKFGKSILMSWLINWLLESQKGHKVVIIASTFNQTGSIYDQVREQIESNPKLKKSDYVISRDKIVNKSRQNQIVRVYSKSSSNLGMVGVKTVAIDQIESMKDSANIEAVRTGMFFSKNPPHTFIFANVPEQTSHWSLSYIGEKKEDPRFHFVDYSAGLKADWDTKEALLEANPFYKLFNQRPHKYSHLKGLARNLEAERKDAQRSEDVSLSYRKFTLGQRISSKAYQWINPQDLKSCELKDVLKMTTRAVLGFDIGLTRDFCACVLGFFDDENKKVFLKPFLHVASIGWRMRSQQKIFLDWHKLGFITIQETETIDKDVFIQDIKGFIKEHNIRIKAHVWDQGLVSNEWTKEFEGNPVLVRCKPFYISAGIRTLEARARDGQIFIVDDNPCLKWMFDCALVSARSKGYVGLNRASPRQSIDGAIATVLCQKWILENKKMYPIIMAV